MKRDWLSTVSAPKIAAVVVCVTFVGTAVADSHSPVSSALAATESVRIGTALADEVVVIAGGGLLVALGLSIVVSSVVTYRYKHKQIRGRLQ